MSGYVRRGQGRLGQVDRSGQVRKVRTGQNWSGQFRTGQDGSGQIRKGQERSGQVRTGKERKGKVRTGQVRTDRDRSGQVRKVRTGKDRSLTWYFGMGKYVCKFCMALFVFPPYFLGRLP